MFSLTADDIARHINANIELALARAHGFGPAAVAAKRVGAVLRKIASEAEFRRTALPPIIIFAADVSRYATGGGTIEALVVGPDDSVVAKVLAVVPDIDGWALTESTTAGVTVVYTRSGQGQALWANGVKLSLSSNPEPSVFSAGSHRDLTDAMKEYGKVVARHSMCGHLQQCWASKAPRAFVPGPEVHMRDSLWQYLRTTLRFYVVDREFTVGAEKPVDVMVDWQQGGQRAFVEVKWLGRSKTSTGKEYSHGNTRAVDGAAQLRDRYVTPYLVEHPDARLLGYLAVFDGRELPETIVFPAEVMSDVRLRLDHHWPFEPPAP